MDKRTKGDDQEENEGGKDNIKFRRKFKRPIKKFIFDKRNSKEVKRKGGWGIEIGIRGERKEEETKANVISASDLL